jgi:hypothetical protein
VDEFWLSNDGGTYSFSLLSRVAEDRGRTRRATGTTIVREIYELQNRDSRRTGTGTGMLVSLTVNGIP